jgi:DNA-binding SARP family transcriptional activator
MLGPLEVVTDDGRRLTLNGSGQRLLLAVLLCQPNHVVSTDVLLDVLWDGSPPSGGRNGLQLKVSRLRAALGSRSRIRHEPGGYVLRVAPGELDAGVFEGLASDGRSALACNDFDKAADLLTEALELWRGPALSGLDDVLLLRDEAARLDERRLTVLESRVDADLATGRHVQLVSELTHACLRYPLRERFRGQLMLALYRSGRQAEALQSYQDARKLLLDEFGVEPGPELRQLELAILRRDASLDLPGRTTLGTSRPVSAPAELPADIASFTGRDDELRRLRTLLDQPRPGVPAVCAIAGAAGVGKSALAIHAAHAVAESFPDGQLYVNLHGATPGVQPLNSYEALRRLLRTLDQLSARLPLDVEEAATRFRTLTAGRRLLIVLDDASGEAQVRPLLPGSPDCAVLLTNRRVLSTLEGAVHVQLGTLAPAEAEQLLARLAGRHRVAAEPHAAAEIVRLCGLLPLAIRAAAARLVARPDRSLAAFAERLGGTRGRLDELEHADLAVRASFVVSLRPLSGAVVRLFELFGLLDVPYLDAATLAALAALPRDSVEAALDRLVDAQLVQIAAPGRYAMHELVRLYSRERAEQRLTATERDAAVRRAQPHYLTTTRAAG